MNAEEHLAVVSELLASPKITAMGAFCMAFGTIIGQKTSRYPPRQIMERLAACHSVAEGNEVYREALAFAEGRRTRQRNGETNTGGSAS